MVAVVGVIVGTIGGVVDANQKSPPRADPPLADKIPNPKLLAMASGRAVHGGVLGGGNSDHRRHHSLQSAGANGHEQFLR